MNDIDFNGRTVIDVSVDEQSNRTVVTLDDGSVHELMGTPIEITNQEIPLKRCLFCGHPSGKYPLFVKDNVKCICYDCVTEALLTYRDNGYNIFFGGDDNEH